MNTEGVALQLQTLFRHKEERHLEVLAAFFSNSKQDDLFPQTFTNNRGEWTLKEKGSDRTDVSEKLSYKCWAIYETQLKEEKVLSTEEVVEDGQ